MLKKFRFTYLLLAFFMALALLAGCGGGGGGGGGGPVIETALGDMRCVDEGTMIACRGIPYAEPPVGDLRFAVPVPHAGWTGTLDAREFGSACVQDNGTGSEDCLFLNVFFPEDAQPGDNLPVMVWIHGGALIQGASSVPGYDVPALVNEGVVVVTINYRLNAFGFLPHPAFEFAEGEDPTGNFGLKDQVMALEWVQDNIGAFGGNALNVTIFGESAGGHSVLSLLVSAAKDADPSLFHKAIVQSGSYSPTQTALSTGYYILGSVFADLNGYPDVVPGFPPTGVGPCSGTNEQIRACLRDLTVEEVMDAQSNSPAWGFPTPVYAEGTFLPKSISTALTDGDVADVPVMIGSNLNEGSLFSAMYLGVYNYFAELTDLQDGVTTLLATDPRVYDRNALAADYADWAGGLYGDNANKYRNAHSMVFTDATFTCNNLAQWENLARAGNNVYAYWFTDADTPLNPFYAPLLEPISYLFNLGNWGFGAAHSFEIQYVFGTVQDHA
ncbi:MAG: carboxylesterase family protein, partial [Syntrophaceae bacterium]|nr:carboxylesterase family protein [Syntrophaceae bacterium]